MSAPAKMWLILSDLHLGEHDPAHVALAVKLVRHYREQVEGVIINGDFLDCTELHASQLGKRQAVVPGRNPFYFLDEVVLGQSVLGAIARAVRPGTKIQFMEGNHEVRLGKLVANYVPQIAGVIPPLRDLLNLAQLGIGWTPYSDHYRVGDWAVEHGHRCNLHACKSTLEEYCGLNVVQGHSHRLKTYAVTTPDGRTLYGVEGGHLRNSQASYTPRSTPRWQSGIVMLTKVGRGQYVHHLIRFDGKRAILPDRIQSLKTNEVRDFWQPARKTLKANSNRLIDAAMEGRLCDL